MSPVGYLVGTIMAFHRDRMRNSDFSSSGYASLAVIIALAFYYNAVRLFSFRVGFVNEEAHKQFTLLDKPVVMAVVLAVGFIGLTIFYGRDKTSKLVLKRIDSLSGNLKRIVNLAVVIFLLGSLVWPVYELLAA